MAPFAVAVVMGSACANQLPSAQISLLPASTLLLASSFAIMVLPMKSMPALEAPGGEPTPMSPWILEVRMQDWGHAFRKPVPL